MFNSNFIFLGNLYAIGGPENFAFVTGKKTQGYIVDVDSGKVKNSFNVADEGFKMPHDVAVTNDGKENSQRPIEVNAIFDLIRTKVNEEVFTQVSDLKH